MRSVLLVGVVAWMLLAVRPAWAGSPPSKDEVFMILSTSLSSAALSVQIANIAAVDKGDFGGCVATAVLKSSFDTAGDFVRSGGRKIPSVQVDLSACMPFAAASPDPVLHERIATVVADSVAIPLSTIQTALYQSPPPDAKCEDLVMLAAMMDYLNALTRPVLQELADPDGAVRVPSKRLELDKCASPPPQEVQTASDAGSSSPGDEGNRKANAEDDMATRLRKLKILLDDGLISQEDYERRKAEILEEL